MKKTIKLVNRTKLEKLERILLEVLTSQSDLARETREGDNYEFAMVYAMKKAIAYIEKAERLEREYGGK